MDRTPVAAPATAAARTPVAVTTRGKLTSHLINALGISAPTAYELTDLEEGDHWTLDLGTHPLGAGLEGRPGGPDHDLWTLAVIGGWWLLLPSPDTPMCREPGCPYLTEGCTGRPDCRCGHGYHQADPPAKRGE